MGRYTALEDPRVDETIENHLQQIVQAVRSRMEPQAIVLRGSFGRGEGSVMLDNGHLHFLSDYEIEVITPSPFYRSRLAKLGRDLTAELGVDTSLRWRMPNYLSVDHVALIPVGPAAATISRYESRYGSRTLYGRDVVSTSPPVDPGEIFPESGLRLLLNRMAESLQYLPTGEGAEQRDLEPFYWANKTILACAESLLLLWGQYHFSYAERGRRFAATPGTRLAFMSPLEPVLVDLVARATEFKLRPRRDLYEESIRDLWLQVIPVCDQVLRHLTERISGFRFGRYVEYPGQYLRHAALDYASLSRVNRDAGKALVVYRYLSRGSRPRGLRMPIRVWQVVYATVPLLFIGWGGSDEALPEILAEARRQLALVCPLERIRPDPRDEWEAVARRLVWGWKTLCC